MACGTVIVIDLLATAAPTSPPLAPAFVPAWNQSASALPDSSAALDSWRWETAGDGEPDGSTCLWKKPILTMCSSTGAATNGRGWAADARTKAELQHHHPAATCQVDHAPLSHSVVFAPRVGSLTSLPTTLSLAMVRLMMTAMTHMMGLWLHMMAQMMVFLMVFLGICTAMAFLLGVECLESMQRVEKWRFVSTVGSMFVLVFLSVWAIYDAMPLRGHPAMVATATTGCDKKSVATRVLHHVHRCVQRGHVSAIMPCVTLIHWMTGGGAFMMLLRQASKTTQVNGKSKRDDRDRSNSQSNQPSNNSRAGNGSSHVASSKRRKSNAMDTLCGQGIPSPVVGQFANLDRSPRKRKRRTVVIWDLDETLVLFASLYNGTYAHIHQKDVHTSVALGEQMMTFLLQTLETHFFFSDLHDTDIDHIHKILPDLENELDANTSDQEFGLTYSVNVAAPTLETMMRTQAEEKKARYAQICAIYERSQAVEFLDNENSNAFNAREALVGAIDEFSCGWLREARILLRELDARSANSSKMNDDSPTAKTTAKRVSQDSDDDNDADQERTFVNVLVTNTQFVPALCKCLIYGLHKYFPVDQVYSSSKVHKRSCFETIVERYGQRADNDTEVDFLAVGDGLEEEYVSKELGLAFHKVQSHQDLRQLRYSLFQKN